MDKAENPAVYTGFGNGGCMDQAAEAVLPEHQLNAVYETMGKPDEKVNAIDRCLRGMEKARESTTQKLPKGMEAHDHSKNHPFAEQDSQGYGSALQAAHQQSRSAQTQQTGISGVIATAKEAAKSHKTITALSVTAVALAGAYVLKELLGNKSKAQGAGIGGR